MHADAARLDGKLREVEIQFSRRTSVNRDDEEPPVCPASRDDDKVSAIGRPRRLPCQRLGSRQKFTVFAGRYGREDERLVVDDRGEGLAVWRQAGGRAEVQRVPALLNEVHALINDHHERLQFILTGSSARKLKRGGANLLVGRAYVSHLHPLTQREFAQPLR